MKTLAVSLAFCAFAFCSAAFPAQAADRMRPGQWVGSTVTGGRTFASSTCVTPADAEAMNGDDKSVRAALEKVIPAKVCRLSDIKANGAQVVYTSVCNGSAPTVITTLYRGDSFESTSSTGVRSTAKLTGPCK